MDIHHNDGIITTDKSLKSIASQFPDLVQVHRKYLINLKYLKKRVVKSDSGVWLIMQNDDEVAVSRRNRAMSNRLFK